MAGASFSLDSGDIDKLIESIQNFQGNAEQVMDEYVQNEVPEIAKPSITNLVPVSDRDKKHAKFNAPFTQEAVTTLSVEIKTRKPWHYLLFPDEARGHNFENRQPLEFMEKGMENRYDEIVNGLLDALLNEWEK